MKLHPLQRSILELFHSNSQALSYSLREIGRAIGEGGKSPQKINHHLKQLENKGYIRKLLPEKRYVVLNTAIHHIVELDLVALASCGENGLYDQSSVIDTIPIPTKLLGIHNKDRYFLVEADGNSMEPEIFSGDIIFIRKTEYDDDNHIYLCIHNDLPKLKRIKKTANTYSLISSNPMYEDVIVSDRDDFHIQGVVMANLRRM